MSAPVIPGGAFVLPPDPFAAPGVDPHAPPPPQFSAAAPAPQPSPGPHNAPVAASPHQSAPFVPAQPMAARFLPGAAPTAMMRPRPAPAVAMGRPDDEIGGHLLGVSTVLVGVGSLLGIRFGGLYGGVAGALFGGAAVNAYRAIKHALAGSPEADREALISGTYALVAGGLGGYVAWKVDHKKATPNPRRATANAARNCGFRPV